MEDKERRQRATKPEGGPGSYRTGTLGRSQGEEVGTIEDNVPPVPGLQVCSGPLPVSGFLLRRDPSAQVSRITEACYTHIHTPHTDVTRTHTCTRILQTHHSIYTAPPTRTLHKTHRHATPQKPNTCPYHTHTPHHIHAHTHPHMHNLQTDHTTHTTYTLTAHTLMIHVQRIHSCSSSCRGAL